MHCDNSSNSQTLGEPRAVSPATSVPATEALFRNAARAASRCTCCCAGPSQSIDRPLLRTRQLCAWSDRWAAAQPAPPSAPADGNSGIVLDKERIRMDLLGLVLGTGEVGKRIFVPTGGGLAT